jgi:triacylglycerol lipase
MARALNADGYCVYPFDYGSGGTDEMTRSAATLAAFVDDVLDRTGATRLSIVGHSQAGLMARYYVKFLGGDRHVDDLVALSPPNHGTSFLYLPTSVSLLGCQACTEQRAGSAFLAHLNGDDETPAPVDYTVVQTRYDEVVIPYTSAFLAGPPGRVTNVTLQELCPVDFVDHVNIPSDPVALQWVENALGRRGPADPGSLPRC